MAVFPQKGGTSGGSYASYYTCNLTVTEQSYSIENNTSYVYYKLELLSGSSGRFADYSASYSVSINGSVKNSGSGSYSLNAHNATLLLCEGYTTIEHGADGKKRNMACSAVLDFSSGSYSPGDFTPSGTMNLTDIPRASKISATDANIGSSSAISVVRYYEGFTHSIQYSFGNLSGYIKADGTTTSTETKISATNFNFTVPTTFYAKIPSAPYGTCTLTIKTYNGNTQIGDAQTATFRATADKTTNAPTVSGATIVDQNSSVVSVTGSNTTLVKYMSKARVTPSITAKNSATISSVTVNNETMTGSYKDINGIDTNTVEVKAIDSRGYPGSKTITISNWVDYLIPTFKAETKFARLTQTSSTIKVTYSGYYYKGTIGNTTNALTLTWQWRNKGETNWRTGGTLTPTLGSTTGKNTFQGTANLSGTYSYQSAFDFRIIATDALNAIGYQMPIGVGTPNHDHGVDSNGNNYFNINATIYKDNVNLFLLIYPVGSIYMSVNSTNPGTLFGGTWAQWGKGRVPVGIDTSQTEFNTVEKTGGSKLLQKHTHSGTTGGAGGHSHSFTGRAGSGTGGTQVETYSSGDNARTITTNTVDNHTHSFTTGEAGTGTSGNLQPYITCYMWKRTA